MQVNVALTRGIAAWALATAAAWLPGLAYAADTPGYWKDHSCASCHGSPVWIGASPAGSTTDPRAFTQRIRVNTAVDHPAAPTTVDWLATPGAFRTKLLGAGVAQMTTLANLTPDPADNVDLNLIRQYLIDVRDAVMPSSLPAFLDTVAGDTRTQTLQIRNSRYLALNFSVSTSGLNSGEFEASGCGVAPGVSANGTIAGAVETSSGSAIFTPSVCTLNVTFKPPVGASGGRNAQLAVSFSDNEGGNPPTRLISLSGPAVPPLEITSGGTASFTTTGPGTTASSTVTIKDRVGSAIQICRRSAPPLDGKTNYTLDAPYTLPPSSDCATVDPGGATATSPRTINVGVTFAPGAVTTPLNAELDVQGSGPDVLTVHLRGNAGPVLTVDALSRFGSTSLEADGSVSADLPLTVSNRGSQSLSFAASPFTIADSTLSDGSCGSVPLATNSGEYSVAANSCGGGLAAYTGATPPSCSLTLRFDPNGLGKRCAVLSISTTDAGVARVVLEGTGFNGPRLVVKEGTVTQSTGVLLDFTSQRPGVSYPSRTLTLTNGGTLGNLALVLPDANAAPGFTTASGAGCAQPLQPFGASTCTISVAFVPTLLQTYASSFTIQSRAADAAPADPYASFAVNLTGQGTDHAPVLSWRDAGNAVIGGLDFGNTAAGNPVERHAVLNNAGPGSARLSLLNIVGIDGVNFEVVPSGCSAGQYLAEGKWCDVTIRFSPGGAGPKTANAQVVSDGNGPGALALQGTGTGSASPGSLSVSSLPAFGTVRVGAQSTPLEATLSNAGSFPLKVTSVEVVGPFKVQMLTCTAPPFTLAPGSSCKATVTFEPTTTGPSQGTLRIATDASSTPTELALSGDAQDAASVSGGGCTLARGNTLVDPTLSGLLLLAAGILWLRRRINRRIDLATRRTRL